MKPPSVSPSLLLSVAPHGPRRIAIIGGGISGLAAAHRIHELDPSATVTVFEASGRLGGVLQTTSQFRLRLRRVRIGLRLPCGLLGLAGDLLLLTTQRLHRGACVLPALVEVGQLVGEPLQNALSRLG